VWAFTGIAWLVYAALLAALAWSTARDGGAGRSWIVPFAGGQAALWWVLTPAIVWLARRATRDRIGLPLTLAIHGAAAVMVALLMSAAQVWLLDLVVGAAGRRVLPRFFYWLDVHVLTYLTVAVVAHALDLHRRFRDRTSRTHLLEAQLSRAQMQFLELQLQPHFLFNCLNSVSELAHEAPEAAERMLRQLHALLRVSLERAGRDEVTLEEELAGLVPYIEIQKTRFSDWLSVEQRNDPRARDAIVPHLILQPLVENAIRHGLAVRSGPGRVEVGADVIGDMLRLWVRDDGVGLSPSRPSTRPGIGLRNTRDRLRQLYDPNYRFVLRAAPGGGTIVELDVPLRRGAPDAQPAGAGAASPQDRTHRTLELPRITAEARSPISATNLRAPLSLLGSTNGSALHAPEPVEDPEALDNDEGSALVTGGWASVRRPQPEPAPPSAPVTDGSAPRLALRQWVAICLGWLFVGLFWSQQVALLQRFGATSGMAGAGLRSWMPDFEILAINLSGALVWAALTPLALYLARRVRLTRDTLVPALCVHVLAAVSLSALHVVLTRVVAPVEMPPALSGINLGQLVGNLFIYSVLLTWSNSRDVYAWFHEHELAGVRIEAAIARSRYQALCVQLRPHFVLGTLELLERMVHRDATHAERLITRLADVLRMTLDSAADAETTVRKELELLRAYVDVYHLGIRPGARLTVSVPAELLGVAMPNRLLRTLADDLLNTFAAEERVELVVDGERLDRATRIRVRAEGLGPAARAGVPWPESVEAAALAQADRSVSLLFPDSRTAIVMLDDRLADVPARSYALAARPA
jgi:LytS/YehU family sensor histidine kinase